MNISEAHGEILFTHPELEPCLVLLDHLAKIGWGPITCPNCANARTHTVRQAITNSYFCCKLRRVVDFDNTVCIMCAGWESFLYADLIGVDQNIFSVIEQDRG